MSYVLDNYTVFYENNTVGYYNVFSDDTATYYAAYALPDDPETLSKFKTLGLDKDHKARKPIRLFSDIICDANRVPGRKQRIYESGPIRLERRSQETDERFSVYRRAAEEGDPDYSTLPHDAPHYEGPHTPKDMREWASWYAFVKMDDGTFEAELDEAWWWGGGHNDGGTIRRPIPEEWFDHPYDEFLENVVRLAAAAHYGFTPEILKSRAGLKEFFGFE